MKKLLVESMSCEHCVKRITTALQEQAVDCTIDLLAKTVSINAAENSLAKAQSVLAEIGYGSVVISDE